MSDSGEILSTAGERRREAILELLRGAARGRRRKRRTVRAGGGIVLVAIATTFLFWRVSRVPVEDARGPVELHGAVAGQVSRVVIEEIVTERGIGERLTMAPRRSQLERIGDDELLQSLAVAGYPAGIISLNGQSVLVTR